MVRVGKVYIANLSLRFEGIRIARISKYRVQVLGFGF